MMSVHKTYNHNALVEEMELFFSNTPLWDIWEYTKRMVLAHNIDEREAWYEFDDTLTGESVSVPLQGVILHLLSHLDENQAIRLHRTITIGRARARGLSRAEALQAHIDALDEIERESPSPILTVIQGGKN